MSKRQIFKQAIETNSQKKYTQPNTPLEETKDYKQCYDKITKKKSQQSLQGFDRLNQQNQPINLQQITINTQVEKQQIIQQINPQIQLNQQQFQQRQQFSVTLNQSNQTQQVNPINLLFAFLNQNNISFTGDIFSSCSTIEEFFKKLGETYNAITFTNNNYNYNSDQIFDWLVYNKYNINGVNIDNYLNYFYEAKKEALIINFEGFCYYSDSTTLQEEKLNNILYNLGYRWSEFNDDTKTNYINQFSNIPNFTIKDKNENWNETFMNGYRNKEKSNFLNSFENFNGINFTSSPTNFMEPATQEEKINNILYWIGYYWAELSHNNQTNDIQNKFSEYFNIDISQNEYVISGYESFKCTTGIKKSNEYFEQKNNYIVQYLDGKNEDFNVNYFINYLNKKHRQQIPQQISQQSYPQQLNRPNIQQFTQQISQQPIQLNQLSQQIPQQLNKPNIQQFNSALNQFNQQQFPQQLNQQSYPQQLNQQIPQQLNRPNIQQFNGALNQFNQQQFQLQPI